MKPGRGGDSTEALRKVWMEGYERGKIEAEAERDRLRAALEGSRLAELKALIGVFDQWKPQNVTSVMAFLRQRYLVLQHSERLDKLKPEPPAAPKPPHGRLITDHPYEGGTLCFRCMYPRAAHTLGPTKTEER